MGAFRFVALAYALAVFLIAPAWLSAGERATPAVPAPPAEQPAAAEDPVTTVPELPPEAPDADAIATGADDLAADSEAGPETVAEPAPEPAKAEKAEPAQKDEPTAKVAASATVTITDFKFTPDTVTVNEGDTVTWTNDGPTIHTATADDGSFDTGTLRKGESGSATFTQAGTIAYICLPHPFMKGKVVVQAASSNTGGDGSSTGSDTGSDDGTAVAGDEESSEDDSGLPDTGAETLLIALLGLATLAAGLLLRRRDESLTRR
jgi:LPXTG-motif cell wall-anchored protein